MTSVTSDGSVEFRFFRPQAGRAGVAGDFNGWRQDLLPMRSEGNGWWVATTTLAPGEYRFKYHADGQWFADYASHGVEASPLGWNAVLVVPRRRVKRRVEEMELAGAL